MNKLITPIIALLISLSAFAQPGGEKMRERIKAQKATFITNQLDLSAEEAQKFWPIYNAYEEKVETLRRNDFKRVRKALEQGSLTDAQAQEALNNYLKSEDEMHQAKRQLVADLKNVLSPKKIIKLKIAEEAFNRQLLDKLKEFRERRGKRRN